MATTRFSSEHDYQVFLRSQAQWPDMMPSRADMYYQRKAMQARGAEEIDDRDRKEFEKRIEEERIRQSRHHAIEAMRDSRKPGSAMKESAIPEVEPTPKPSDKNLLLLLEDV